MRIENFRDGSRSNVVGEFDVALEDYYGTSIKNVRMIESAGGKRFLSYPSYSVEDGGAEEEILSVR